MTKFGETYGFRASNFLRTLESYLGSGVLDYFILNTERPHRKQLKPYIKERADIVEIDDENLPQVKPTLLKARLLRRGALIRHDPEKLGRLITMLI
jgi:2-phospho-L-lactate transferase/gluconeogenesis factor (CofD/UPF0052 family)